MSYTIEEMERWSNDPRTKALVQSRQKERERIAVLEAENARQHQDYNNLLSRYDLLLRELAEERARLVLIRKLLWLRHGCPLSALYGDDGEMQCATCRIDFKRQEPTEIDAAFDQLARAAIEAARGENQPAND